MRRVISLIFLFFVVTLITGCSNEIAGEADATDVNIDDIDMEINELDDSLNDELNEIEGDIDSS